VRRDANLKRSSLCDLYREWAGRLKPTLRQVHIAGERLFVDFAGHTMEVIDAATGEIQRAKMFDCGHGCSSPLSASFGTPRRKEPPPLVPVRCQ
jgi:transposase